MQTHTISTQQILAALWRAKWMIAVCTIIGIVLAIGLAALFMPPHYETSVVFLLQGPQQDLVESSCYILKTRESLDAVADKAGSVCTREELAEMLTAEILGDTQLMEVTIRYSDPAIVKQVADAVAEVLPQRLGRLYADATAEVADAPELPKQAIGPDFLMIGLLGLLMGVALPVCVVTTREYGKIT